MTDTWVDIKGYEGLYAVNREGQIKSIRRCKILMPLNNNNGYRYVCLSGQKRIGIHRILAITFLDNPHNKPCVNHKNGNKQDNRIDNLEWVTYSENTFHAFKIGLMIPYDRSGSKNSNYKPHLHY